MRKECGHQLFSSKDVSSVRYQRISQRDSSTDVYLSFTYILQGMEEFADGLLWCSMRRNLLKRLQSKVRIWIRRCFDDTVKPLILLAIIKFKKFSRYNLTYQHCNTLVFNIMMWTLETWCASVAKQDVLTSDLDTPIYLLHSCSIDQFLPQIWWNRLVFEVSVHRTYVKTT